MRLLENRIPPPLVFLLLGSIMVGAAYLVPLASMLPFEARVALGAGLFLAAGAFGPFAVAAFGKAKTTIDPVNIERASTLVTSGVFSVTRNPMYLSMALILLAIAAALANPWVIIGPIVFVAYITRFQIIPEERMLTARFGNTYTAYRSRVRRWI